MKYLVTYDVHDDKAREAVAEILLGYGNRIQLPVFEIWLDDDQELAELVNRLRLALKRNENGDIRLYRLCRRCSEESIGLGEVDTSDDGAAWIF